MGLIRSSDGVKWEEDSLEQEFGSRSFVSVQELKIDNEPKDKNVIWKQIDLGKTIRSHGSFWFLPFISPPFPFLSLLFRSAGHQSDGPPVAVGDGGLTGECDWTMRSLTSA